MKTQGLLNYALNKYLRVSAYPAFSADRLKSRPHWRRSRQKVVNGDFLSTSTSTPVWTSHCNEILHTAV